MTESRVLYDLNDKFWSEQWAFHPSANGADINMQEGWKEYQSLTANSQNGNEVIIAVIDSGVDYKHPDLIDAMWTNPGEVPKFHH